MKRYQSTWKASTHLKVFFIVCSIFLTICIQNVDAQEGEKHYLKRHKNAEIFADVGGSLHGIVFDNRNNMYVGKNGNEILKISSQGEISPFVVIREASGYYSDGPGDTFIYDMEFGNDRHLYVAAEDRILKISPTGQVEILLKSDFKGTWGVCGIALDNKGNVFASFDNKVLKIQPGGEQSIFLDSTIIGIKLDAVVGIEFDNFFKNIYICDGLRDRTGQLIQVPILANGSPGTAKVIFKKKGYRPEYVSFNPKNNMVIKGPENSDFVLIKRGQSPIIIEMKNTGLGEIETIAFGKEGFRQNSIYGTEWYKGKIYRIDF